MGKGWQMKTQEIVKHITELKNYTSYDGRYKLKYALASTLPDKAFMKFVEDEGFPEIYDKSITRRGLNNRLSCRQRNAIKKEIEELSSPQCKRKTFLRDNLKSRYKYAFPKDQEKVLRCMLFQPSVKERQWAYSKLTASWSKWDGLFEKDVITIFEKYKDKDCATLIVKCLPTSYIYDSREKLAEKVGWQRVIVTIGKDYPDTIDLSKLNTEETIRTIVNLGLHEHRKFIENILYTNILREIEYILSEGRLDDDHRITENDMRFFLLPFYATQESRDSFYCEKDWGNMGKGHLPYYWGVRPPEDTFNYLKTLSLRGIAGVGLALWAMGRLGMAAEIVQFSKYDMATEETIEYSISDCQNVPIKIETWLFKVYNYIRANVYGEQPLSDDELIKRFVNRSYRITEGFVYNPNIIQPLEVPKALSEPVGLLEDIGFVATKIDVDVPK